MTDFISILQSAALQASELIPKREEATDLRWHLNYKWLINPPVQCPWCKDWLPTGRVWVVDEAERKVRRVWKLNGERLNVKACHPHVGSGGMICMGSAPTAVDALTASLSTDAYVQPKQWLPEELGHRCPTMGDSLDDGDEDDEDHFICVSCGTRGHNDDRYVSDYTEDDYCDSCYWDVHTSCCNCGVDFHENQSNGTISTPDGEYCNVCISSRFFECDGCDEVFRLDQCMADNRCESCYSEKWESCSQCGEESEVADGELDDNRLCENCRPQESECIECHFDYLNIELVNDRCPDCWHKCEQEEETHDQ